MFPPLSYHEWIEGRPAVSPHDLGSSDLRGDRGFEPEVVPGPLVDLPDPPAGVSVETLLATEYGVHPEQVLVTAGASHANLLAAATVIDLHERESPRDGAEPSGDDAGDGDAAGVRILVERPGYEPLVRTPEGLGATVDRFRRTAPAYELDPERVEAAIRDGTRLVSVTNRHNPSGWLADRETLAAVAGVVRDAGARLLVDEVYAPYLPADRTTDGPFGGPSAVGLDGAVVTGSLTKFFGLSDLRLGWFVGDREFVRAAKRIAPHLPGVAGPSRALAARALYSAETLAEGQRELLAANARLLAEFVEARDDLAGEVPAGGPFAFLEPTSVEAAELVEAAAEGGVLVVPGRFFDDSERVRLSLGRSPDEMESALAHLGAVLDRFR